MSGRRIGMALALLACGVVTTEAHGQWQRTDVGWCEEEWGGRDQDRHCLILEADFDGLDELTIDGGQNGGVNVEGWARSTVEVRAKVWARARSLDRAEEIAASVDVFLRGGELGADGPDTGRRESWGVTWEVMVPHETDLEIQTNNGGISVMAVNGRIRFDAKNGGVHLTDLGGDVTGRTTNGGLHVELDGASWSGRGLDVETTNGGVTLQLPEDYSAELETGTVNGGIDIDFPVTVQGRIGRRLTTTLGEGGPMVRAVTTNGGVRITRGGRVIR